MVCRFMGCLGREWTDPLAQPIVRLEVDERTGNFVITVDGRIVDFSPGRGDGYTLLEDRYRGVALAWRLDGTEYVATARDSFPEVADDALLSLRHDMDAPQRAPVAASARPVLLWEGDQA